MGKTKLVIAVTGSSGVVCGYRLLLACSRVDGIETHVVVSQSAKKIVGMETEITVDKMKEYSDYYYDEYDFTAPISSGSFVTHGMIIAPCSMKTLSSIATGYEHNLVARAAMVTLKERRTLILLTRETPLSLIHLRNMVQVTEAGGIVMPPLPPLYFKVKDMDDMVDLTIGRVLSMMGITTVLLKEWGKEQTLNP